MEPLGCSTWTYPAPNGHFPFTGIFAFECIEENLPSEMRSAKF
jgi:hypothetical protein